MSNNSSDSGAFVVGFIVGGLVGAAVALLLSRAVSGACWAARGCRCPQR